MQEKHPLTIAIMLGILTELAYAYIFAPAGNWVAPVAALALLGLAYLILKQNVGVMIMGLLASALFKAQEFAGQRRTVAFAVILSVLGIVVAYELIRALAEGRSSRRGVRPPPSFGAVMAFAMAGQMVPYAAFVLGLYLLCGAPAIGQGGLIVSWVQHLLECPRLHELVMTVPISGDVEPVRIVQLVLGVCCGGFLISPMTWSIFFAVMRQRNFQVFPLRRIVGRMVLGYMGVGVVGLITYIAAVVVAFGWVAFVQTSQYFSPQLFDVGAIGFPLAVLVASAFGATAGARLGGS